MGTSLPRDRLYSFLPTSAALAEPVTLIGADEWAGYLSTLSFQLSKLLLATLAQLLVYQTPQTRPADPEKHYYYVAEYIDVCNVVCCKSTPSNGPCSVSSLLMVLYINLCDVVCSSYHVNGPIYQCM